MSLESQKRWLKVTAVVVGGFAPVLFLGTLETTDGLAHWTLDLLSWPLDSQPAYSAPATRFLSALAGGFLLGWGLTIWHLSGAAFDAAPEPIRRAVVVGLVAWFVLDSAGSITSGNPSNVLFNVVILLVAVGPLWRRAQSGASRQIA